MISDSVSVSIAPLSARVGACEMCSVGQEQLRTGVLVQHVRGGAVELTACDRCAAAMRRLLAVAGSAGPSGPIYVVANDAKTVEPQTTAEPAPAESRALDVVAEPVLVYEFSEPLSVGAGQEFVVRVYGQERSDGTWIGWLTFVGTDGQIKRTARETTQSTREHVVYWATGLQPSFLEGAFNRAN